MKGGRYAYSDSVHARTFKAKAKSLHRSVKAGEMEGLVRIQSYFDDPTGFKLTQAQPVIARELHCTSWRQLVQKQDWLKCSFCKKWQYDLIALIAGPDSLHVCDECVRLCNEIIKEQVETS